MLQEIFCYFTLNHALKDQINACHSGQYYSIVDTVLIKWVAVEAFWSKEGVRTFSLLA